MNRRASPRTLRRMHHLHLLPGHHEHFDRLRVPQARPPVHAARHRSWRLRRLVLRRPALAW